MPDSLLATQGSDDVYADDSDNSIVATLRGKARWIEFLDPDNVCVFVAAALTPRSHIHASLVLASGTFDEDFKLSWVGRRGRRFKMVMLHRMSDGIRVRGVDRMREVKSELASISDYTGEFKYFKFAEVPGLQNISIDLDDFANCLNNDLQKDLCVKPTGITQYNTNCVIFPTIVCMTFGLPVEDVRYFKDNLADEIDLPSHLVDAADDLLDQVGVYFEEEEEEVEEENSCYSESEYSDSYDDDDDCDEDYSRGDRDYEDGYRVKCCRFHKRGYCKFGMDCIFRHVTA